MPLTPRRKCAVIPMFAARRRENVVHGEKDEIQAKSDQCDEGVSQEGKPLKGGMEDKHRVFVIGDLRGSERAENKIAIKADEIHAHHRNENIAHISEKIGAQIAENGD